MCFYRLKHTQRVELDTHPRVYSGATRDVLSRGTISFFDARRNLVLFANYVFMISDYDFSCEHNMPIKRDSDEHQWNRWYHEKEHVELYLDTCRCVSGPTLLGRNRVVNWVVFCQNRKSFFCIVREMACKTRIKRVCNKLSVRGERAGRVALGQKLVGPILDFFGWG